MILNQQWINNYQPIISSPPSIRIILPVNHELLAWDNKQIYSAISSGVVNLPDGLCLVAKSIILALPGIFLRAGVSVTPACIALTPMKYQNFLNGLLV